MVLLTSAKFHNLTGVLFKNFKCELSSLVYYDLMLVSLNDAMSLLGTKQTAFFSKQSLLDLNNLTTVPGA